MCEPGYLNLVAGQRFEELRFLSVMKYLVDKKRKPHLYMIYLKEIEGFLDRLYYNLLLTCKVRPDLFGAPELNSKSRNIAFPRKLSDITDKEARTVFEKFSPEIFLHLETIRKITCEWHRGTIESCIVSATIAPYYFELSDTDRSIRFEVFDEKKGMIEVDFSEPIEKVEKFVRDFHNDVSDRLCRTK